MKTPPSWLIATLLLYPVFNLMAVDPIRTTRFGDGALSSPSLTGANNTAIGYQSIFNNTNGTSNTATGVWSLYSNTSGADNTAFGTQSLYQNTTGYGNMAIGTYALYTNNTGSQNVAIGYRSLDNNTTGGANIANGTESLHLNSTGTGNVAIGLQALYNNTTGILNIAIGHQTGFFATGSYNIYIGNPGIASESNAIRIGTPGTHTATYLSGNVFCQSLNITSDRNAKERFTAVNAREVLDKVSRMPITEWQYKTDSEIRHIGPMAQDFHKAFSVGSDEKHITTVDADGVALAAIQGLNEKLEEQVARKDADMGKLKSENHALAERLNALEKKLGLGRAQTSRAKR